MQKKIFYMALCILTIAILLTGCKKNKESVTTGDVQENIEEEVVTQNNIKVFSGDSRPIAVMIDNNKDAWPHVGIDKAYLVYEIIVEGGETRLMALFKGVDVDEIGPIRSARHYFLDYALENDAIYVHLGWSPQAQSQISKLGVNNINGQAYDTGKSRTETSKFWRESSKAKPHNAMTSTESIKLIAEEKKYAITSKKKSVLNYVPNEVNLDNGTEANTIVIPYSGNSNTVKYEFDKENNVYVRYSKGTKQIEGVSHKSITTKNIIITFAENYTIADTEDKGRQDLKNVGNLKGYYITNGKAIEITCEKNSRTSQTVYKDLNGNEIEVNDGNTFIQIVPINQKVTIS